VANLREQVDMGHHTETPTGRASVAALLEVPEHNALTKEQARGADCAWCGKPLTAETAVDLGERRIQVLDTHFDTFPRGCRPCASKRAYGALFGHAEACDHCRKHPSGCEIGDELRRLSRGAHL
jgi:hypothetical protein